MQEHPRVAAERQLPGQHLVEDDPQAVDVATAIDLVGLAPRLLGAHVGRRAQHLAVERHRDLARFTLGQPEVHQVRPARLVEHDVRGLDVAMHDPLFVRVLQGVGHLGDQAAASRSPSRPLASLSARVTPGRTR